MEALTRQCLTGEQETERKRTLWGSHFMDCLVTLMLTSSQGTRGKPECFPSGLQAPALSRNDSN